MVLPFFIQRHQTSHAISARLTFSDVTTSQMKRFSHETWNSKSSCWYWTIPNTIRIHVAQVAINIHHVKYNLRSYPDQRVSSITSANAYSNTSHRTTIRTYRNSKWHRRPRHKHHNKHRRPRRPDAILIYFYSQPATILIKLCPHRLHLHPRRRHPMQPPSQRPPRRDPWCHITCNYQPSIKMPKLCPTWYK